MIELAREMGWPFAFVMASAFFAVTMMYITRTTRLVDRDTARREARAVYERELGQGGA